MSVEYKRHWKEIDVLYTIGIILVLIGHSHSSDWSTFQGTVLDKIIRFIYTFHMPLFFFISGFLFQNSKTLEVRGYKSWICDKAVRLFSPYFFWSLIALMPKYWVEHRSFAGVGRAITDVFINPRASVWGHFWFLPVLFLTYVLFGAVRKWTENRIVTIGLWISSIIIYYLPINTPILGLFDLHLMLFYFATGMSVNLLLGKRKTNIPKWVKVVWIVIVSGMCMYFASLDRFGLIFGNTVALLMISVCWVMAEMIDVMGWISSHNFTIYIFSWFFQAVVMAICEKLAFGWLGTFFMMFTAGLIGPALIIVIYEKFAFLHKRNIRLVLGMRE